MFSSHRYIPYPGGGEKWGGNGVGDDLYSFGFDGAFLCTGKLVGESLWWIIIWNNTGLLFHQLKKQSE